MVYVHRLLLWPRNRPRRIADFLQSPAIIQTNCELLVSTLCRQCSDMSYADFARVDDPSPREPNTVSLGAVIFVDEFEEEALVNPGSILRKRAQHHLWLH